MGDLSSLCTIFVNYNEFVRSYGKKWMIGHCYNHVALSRINRNACNLRIVYLKVARVCVYCNEMVSEFLRNKLLLCAIIIDTALSSNNRNWYSICIVWITVLELIAELTEIYILLLLIRLGWNFIICWTTLKADVTWHHRSWPLISSEMPCCLILT